MWILTEGLDLGVSKVIGDAAHREMARRKNLVQNPLRIQNILRGERFSRLNILGIVSKGSLVYSDVLTGAVSFPGTNGRFVCCTSFPPFWRSDLSWAVQILFFLRVKKHPNLKQEWLPACSQVLWTQRLRSSLCWEPSVECSPVKAWSRSEYSYACFTHSQEFLPYTNFYHPRQFHSPAFFFPFSRSSPYLSTVLVLVDTVSCVVPQNQYFTLLLVTNGISLSRCCSECLWNRNRHQNVCCASWQ